MRSVPANKIFKICIELLHAKKSMVNYFRVTFFQSVSIAFLFVSVSY